MTLLYSVVNFKYFSFEEDFMFLHRKIAMTMCCTIQKFEWVFFLVKQLKSCIKKSYIFHSFRALPEVVFPVHLNYNVLQCP